MPLTSLPHDAAPSAFPQLLKSWRQKRRLSQLDLALDSGVSQRHVSFLESGRAKPSRAMILQLSATLAVPLRERNDWLLAAGFAPVFQARSLDDPQMHQVLAAVRMMLANHAPFPALAIDRAWNIRLANEPFERLVAMFGAGVWNQVGGGARNMMRLFFHPNGIRPYVGNWATVAPLVWPRACREAENPGRPDQQALASELSPCPESTTHGPPHDPAPVPVMPLVLEKDGQRLSLFTVIATFGTAQDITTDELRIESLFPADAATEKCFAGA